MARILSIEDDAELQHLIGHVLFKEGYEINYAWNGREGYEKILSYDPDLILLDLMLPMMNGVELLEKLRNDKVAQGTPIIVVSALQDEVGMLGQSIRALGAVEYLRKPVNPNDLAAYVKRVLAQHPRPSRPPAAAAPEALRKGAVRADPQFRTVLVNDRLVATLSAKPFALLRCLMESAGPVSREDLLLKLGYGPRQSDALKQEVHRLRQDLGKAEMRRIRTTPEGYELIG